MSGHDIVSKGIRETALVSALIIQLVGTGCGSPSRAETSRLIHDMPGEIWDRSTWTRSIEVFDWTFSSPEDLLRWTPHGIDLRFEVRNDALRINWSTTDAYLEASVNFDAHDIEIIEITMGAMESYPGYLYWRGSEQGFRSTARISPRTASSQMSRAKTYTYMVGSHPEWRGRMRSLQLHFVTNNNNRMRIERIRGLREDLDEKKLLEAIERPWKVELGPELRNGILAKPNDAIAHEFDVPGSGGLWFGYGVWPYDVEEVAAGSVVFRVFAERPGSDDELLFEDKVPVRRVSEARWRSGWLDLAPFAAQRMRLRFETESSFEGFAGLPVWGAPEVSNTDTEMPNVVLVSIDTLRADHMSLHGYAKSTTPNIDRWAQQRGVVFESAVASSPWTLPSHVSMLTGLDALSHGVNYSAQVPAMLNTLAEILRNTGYATAAFTGGGYLHPSYGVDQGFDLWHWEKQNDVELEHNIHRVGGFLKNNRHRPYFLFFHTFEVHAPLRARQPYFSSLYPDSEQGLSTKIDIRTPSKGSDNLHDRIRLPFWNTEDRRWLAIAPESYPMVTGYYDAGIAYTDAKIQELLEMIETNSTRETVIVLTSDHGEHLGEQGLFGHFSLLDGNLRVPLVISLPGTLPAGRRIAAQVGSVDIVPTVLDLLHLQCPAEVDGESLVDLIKGENADREGEAWSYSANHAQGVSLRVNNELKYTLNNSALRGVIGNQALFDLREDPNELTDVSESSDSTAELARRVDLRLASRPGLHILLWNDAQSPVRGLLRGEAVRRRRIKARQLPPQMENWPSKGHFAFRLPAGAQAEMVVEGAREDLLTVADGWDPSDISEATSVWPLPGSGPWTFGHTSSGWHLIAVLDERPLVGLQLRWIGPRITEGDKGGAEVSAELEEQLRALGYAE